MYDRIYLQHHDEKYPATLSARTPIHIFIRIFFVDLSKTVRYKEIITHIDERELCILWTGCASAFFTFEFFAFEVLKVEFGFGNSNRILMSCGTSTSTWLPVEKSPKEREREIGDLGI
ncbi:hypothetical protein BDQ12DRAFT_666652 [Crucibulum laeve]|uniref:Uncharacterized protein n=1 Tax=Crucibulum laeve TaxID=68775 RepID=A0A5C3M044_9AGAR|nr:hypothetical protein BDQ12DRAFT_666652 [Crucibulum laeve]